MDNILACCDKQNKDKNGKHFHNQRIFFPLFVIYVNYMLVKEAIVVLVNLSRLVAVKMDKPIFTCAYLD